MHCSACVDGGEAWRHSGDKNGTKSASPPALAGCSQGVFPALARATGPSAVGYSSFAHFAKTGFRLFMTFSAKREGGGPPFVTR